MKSQIIFSNPSSGREQLSRETQRLILKYQEIFKPQPPEGAVVHVDEIASKVASLYEKARGIVDWKEEHLIRRTAIERALKRRLISKLSGRGLASNLRLGKIAEPLVLELTRGGHFPNGKIPKRKLVEVQKVLDKYIYILQNNPLSRKGAPPKIKRKVNFYNWILEIAACEIEEILDLPLKENALIEYMTDLIAGKIQVEPKAAMSEAEKRIQTYIAVHQTLFRLDAPIISYRLLKYRYPAWTNPPSPWLERMTKGILAVGEQIESDLHHPLANNFVAICEKYDTPYLILGDILKSSSQKPAEIPRQFAHPKRLNGLVEKFYRRRLSTLKSRLFRMAVYSTLSVFVASGFSLFVIEVPIAKFFYGHFQPLAIFVDIILPTVLMFALVAMVRLPRESNLVRVKEEVRKIVYQQRKEDTYEIRANKKRGPLTMLIISLLYLAVSLLSLGFVFWIFYLARVPITSVYIDTLNVAVIVFAALIIRQRAKELVVEERANFLEFLIDALSVPMARIGQWLANKWKEYNIVSVFFTILIDVPFMTLVEFVENWSSFIKEKKAQLH